MEFRRAQTPGKVLVELDREESLPLWAIEKATPLFQLENVLVPIDFSECSKKALVYALPYAREFGAAIFLLYVAPVRNAESETDSARAASLQEETIERARAELQKLAQELPSCIEVKTAVASGRAFEEIVVTAEAVNADLIVIGTHGAMGLRREVLGSTAERVARYANCPVLVVRERERDFVSTHRAETAAGTFPKERSMT